MKCVNLSEITFKIYRLSFPDEVGDADIEDDQGRISRSSVLAPYQRPGSFFSGQQSSGILSLKCVGGGVTIRNKVMAGWGFIDGQI